MTVWTKTVAGCLAAMLVIASAPGPAMAADYWQCVPAARILSGIQLFGDAYTWWRQAPGKYETGTTPAVGAVLVFKASGKMRKGHVAVVSQVISEREVQVDHANWSQIDGHRGKIEENVRVIDVSPAGDWSQVKVWYDPAHDVGTTVYPVYGFIYQDDAAVRQAGVVDGVQLAANFVGGLPAAAGLAATQTGDAIGALIQSLTSGARGP
jgi:surface antigen